MHVVPPPLRHDHSAAKHVGKKIQEYRECKQEKTFSGVDRRDDDFSQAQRCDEICTLSHN